MFDSHTFDGKRILITGAGSGIGKASAQLLASLGAEVILVGRSTEKLHDTACRIGNSRVECIASDLCAFDQYGLLFDKSVKGGKLDGLLHCAGIAKPTPVKALSMTSITELFETNLFSFFMLTKWFSKKKYSNDRASIVACSAVNVHYPQKCMCAYEASKGGLESAVRGMAEELYTGRKLRINALVIGPVVTPMAGFPDGDVQAVGTHSDVTPNLMGMASPVDIASMAAFLLDDSSAYTTGRNFYVDGGRL